MNRNSKIYFCQECQEMTYHPTSEHDESTCTEYYTRRLKTDENSEDFGSGYSLVSLVV